MNKTTNDRAVTRVPAAGLLATLAIMAIALAWLLMSQPGTAEADDISLVSNTNQTAPGGQALQGTEALATEFTTGSGTGAHLISSVQLRWRTNTTNTSAITVTINHDAGTNPGGVVATFTNPSALINGLNTFTLSDPVGLSPSTTYFLMATVSGSSQRTISLTSSGSQTGEAGWSIANSSRQRNDSGIWSSNNSVLVFDLLGATHDALVSNITETEHTGGTTGDSRVATSFTTGSAAKGYAVESVTIQMDSTTLAVSNMEVQIREGYGTSNQPRKHPVHLHQPLIHGGGRQRLHRRHSLPAEPRHQIFPGGQGPG